MEEYEKRAKEYVQISSETRNKLTALSVTVIGGIYFLFDKLETKNIFLLKLSLTSFILTILIEIISGFLKSQHYALWIDGKIKTIDYRESVWGKMCEWSFVLSLIPFTIGSVLFFIGIFIK